MSMKFRLPLAILAVTPLAAPLLAGSHPVAAMIIRSFFSRLCHQDPARSFLVDGSPVAVCVRWPLRTRYLRSGAPAGSGHPYLPWLGLVLVFVVCELFNYLVHGTRADHPTFSSITDAIDRTYVLKALLFLGWLAGASVIVRSGSRAQLRKARVRP